MRFLINASTLKIGGAMQVANSFFHYLPKYSEHNFLIVASKEVAAELNKNDLPNNIELIIYNQNPSYLGALFGVNKYLSHVEKSFKPNAVFTVFGASYWKPKAKHLMGFARPSIVYIDSPFFDELSFKDKLRLKIKNFFLISDFRYNTKCIVTENQDVSNRLQTIFKQKTIHTVTNFYNQVFENESIWDKSIKLDIKNKDSFKIVTISANYPHKNLKIIKEIIPILISKYANFKFTFFITQPEEIFGKDFCNKYNDYLVCLGKVTINQCPNLYKQSDAMFLPTLLECFSASYPEAMLMNNVILTSNINFAKGICDNAAQYFDPLNPNDIAEKIYQVATNPELKNQLTKNGLERLKSFDNSSDRADKYIKILENISNT